MTSQNCTVIAHRNRTQGNQLILRQHQTVVMGSIKLNTKKLPEDFFGNTHKMPPLSHRVLHRIRKTPQTQRNYPNQEQFKQKNDDILPEAQVTSFFKAVDSSNVTTQSSQKYEQQNSGGSGFTQSHIDSSAYKDCALSIQLSREYQPYFIKDDLLCTFAKHSESDTNNYLMTPLKRSPTRQLQLDKTKQRSSQLLKKPKKQSFPPKLSSSSRKRRNSSQFKGQTLAWNTDRKSTACSRQRKISEELLFPKIHNYLK